MIYRPKYLNKRCACSAPTEAQVDFPCADLGVGAHEMFIIERGKATVYDAIEGGGLPPRATRSARHDGLLPRIGPSWAGMDVRLTTTLYDAERCGVTPLAERYVRAAAVRRARRRGAPRQPHPLGAHRRGGAVPLGVREGAQLRRPPRRRDRPRAQRLDHLGHLRRARVAHRTRRPRRGACRPRRFRRFRRPTHATACCSHAPRAPHSSHRCSSRSTASSSSAPARTTRGGRASTSTSSASACTRARCSNLRVTAADHHLLPPRPYRYSRDAPAARSPAARASRSGARGSTATAR